MSEQTIILLDDDEDLCNYFGTFLESAGFTVITAGNSQDIVELVEKNQASLLISDLVMPDYEGMDGIFKILSRTKIPIIAISSYQQYLKMVESVVTASLHKPFSTQELLDCVHKVLHIPVKPQ